jgi:3-oxoacyl-[acyl-carrier-protein] synthase-3
LDPTYVDSFKFVLGERKYHVNDSEAAGRLFSSAEDLKMAGFRWHHICEPETTAYDLACGAVRPIADKAAGADAIVYATCLPLNGNVGSEAEWRSTRDVKHLMDFPVSRLQADFGLDKAIAIGLNQQACTSMLGSMRIASALLACEPQWQRVLCVSADRFPENAVYEQAYSLISDGAAACIVSREPAPGSFRLITNHQITMGGMGTADDDQTVGTYFGFAYRLIAQTLERAQLKAGDLDWMITQNINDAASTVLAHMFGIEAEKVVSSTMPDSGHVISADNVLNLTALAESGRIESGQKLLLHMAGFGLNWQSTILEAV